MPHSEESDVIIRWIVNAGGSVDVLRNHLRDRNAINLHHRKPQAKTVDQTFHDHGVSVSVRFSTRDSHLIVWLSGENASMIAEVKDFFARHRGDTKLTVEFRDP